MTYPHEEEYYARQCLRCGLDISIHPKCLDCLILVYERNKEYECRCGRQHGIAAEGAICLDCKNGENVI